MSETKWWNYLQGLMGPDNQQEAAQRVGVSKSNFTRWKNGARADPEFVVKIARGYGANVLEALVAAEFLTAEEANLREVSVGGREAILAASDDALLDEVMRRMRSAQGMTLTSVEHPENADDYDLAARESGRPILRAQMDDHDEWA